ncbi:hypothetical protein LQG66_33755 [Bradyrhizobium ontarionense]|uniref:Uncharacterized protein n=1 Tax=Bradyrhizobium ontarionense TaxID=2898149 RepID=A0ABY3R9Q0_9BRAD|nr:hypothetical protein [Bradyrhizobium sp. A19]UFZ04104.1 hypothetical protein LQG66_33755 [Bradyrhizobium sp. A19]
MSTAESLGAAIHEIYLRGIRLGQRGDIRLRMTMLCMLMSAVVWLAIDSGPSRSVQRRMLLADLKDESVYRPGELPATITSQSYGISAGSGGPIRVGIATSMLINDLANPQQRRCTVLPEVVNSAQVGIADLEFGLNYVDATGSTVASSLHGIRMLGRGEARYLDFARLNAPNCEGLRAEMTVSFCRSENGTDCGSKAIGAAFGSIPIVATGSGPRD